MPERRGVKRNKSLKNLIADEATREAVRNIEDRLISIERRLSIPAFIKSTQDATGSLGPSPAGSTQYDIFTQSFTSKGGIIFGRIVGKRQGATGAFGTIHVTHATVDPIVYARFFRGNPSFAVNSIATLEVDAWDGYFGGGGEYHVNPATLWFVDQPGDGEFSYTFSMQTGTINTTIDYNNIAFELFEIYPLR